MKKRYIKPVLGFTKNTSKVDGADLGFLPEGELHDIVQRSREWEEERAYRTNPDVVVRQIGDEWVLVPTGELAELTNSMITINEFCYFLWHQFEQTASLRQVLQAAREEYNDPNRLLEVEVRNFVHDYHHINLLNEIK